MSFRHLVAGLLATGLLVAVLTGMAGCNSSRRASRQEPVDQQYAQSSRAARLAFQKGDYQTAANLYRKTLQRAFVRDALEAIVDTRYNLAVCLLKLERYEEALSLTDLATAELTRAGHEIPPEFDLLKATLCYRQGRSTQAWSLTDALLSNGTNLPPLVYSRTHYIRGRIAADKGDAASLKSAIFALGQPSLASLKADLQELRGHLAMLEKRWDEAVSAFDDAARLRRQAAEYLEMAVALALAGQACEKAGHRDAAAQRYLQAGRSAVARGATAQGRSWLEQVLKLADPAEHTPLVTEARSLLAPAAGKKERPGAEAASSDRSTPAATPQ